jgi:hypothetical protein
MIFALLAVVALAAAGTYWLVQRRPPPPARATPAPKAGGRFSGVEIRTHGGACRAAEALRGRRFLAKDAPTLPLQGCTFGRCACTFSKLKDRRTESRRLDYGALNASLLLATNRRTNKDRRRAAARAQRV